MAQQPQPQPCEGATLDALVATEQRLEERLARARADAQTRIQQAQEAAKRRLSAARKAIADEAARRLEDRKRQLDAHLAREARELEDRIADVMAAMGPLRKQLCERMLGEVLGT